MFDWTHIVYQQEHYKDLLREAENERLVRLAKAGRDRRERLYGRAMIWLGRRLVAWGSSLQEHFGTTPSATTLRAAQLPR